MFCPVGSNRALRISAYAIKSSSIRIYALFVSLKTNSMTASESNDRTFQCACAFHRSILMSNNRISKPNLIATFFHETRGAIALSHLTRPCSRVLAGTVIAIWLFVDGGVFPRARFASACEPPGDAGRFDIFGREQGGGGNSIEA